MDFSICEISDFSYDEYTSKSITNIVLKSGVVISPFVTSWFSGKENSYDAMVVRTEQLFQQLHRSVRQDFRYYLKFLHKLLCRWFLYNLRTLEDVGILVLYLDDKPLISLENLSFTHSDKGSVMCIHVRFADLQKQMNCVYENNNCINVTIVSLLTMTAVTLLARLYGV